MKNQVRHSHFLSLWLRVGLILALLVCGWPVAPVRAASTLTGTSSANIDSGLQAASATTFTYTGAEQTYTVPSDVCQVAVDAFGAQGGSYGLPMGSGGYGGRVQATIAATVGQTLYIYVGGGGGYNGGGSGGDDYGGSGGGASDVRQGGNGLGNRVVVAGGGGGGGGFEGGGDGGFGGGGNGGYGGGPGGYGGYGGSQSSGGHGGYGVSDYGVGYYGDNGYYGGGGGGGGGPGVVVGGGGGGGGSNLVPSGGTSSIGVWPGNGQVILNPILCPVVPTVVFGSNTFPIPNASLAAGVDYVTLEFNIDVKGAADPQSANLPGNYLLFSDGGDGFQTVNCAGGVAATDVSIPVGRAFYDNRNGAGPFLVNVTVNNATPLPAGRYRFLACGTTSIENLAGTELNNGADSSLEFSVVASAAAASGDASQSDSSDGASKAAKTKARASKLPATGFAPGRVSSLPPQPAAAAYQETTLSLSIPKLGLNLPIVGVPETASGWDVTWLGKNVGYLEGTAYPTWTGNTVLTGHVWDALNQPGPFARLKTLRYGDQVQIQLGDKLYVYEVRENRSIAPQNVAAALTHEEYAWLTLLTCEDYNSLLDDYAARRMVRAVLVSVK